MNFLSKLRWNFWYVNPEKSLSNRRISWRFFTLRRKNCHVLTGDIMLHFSTAYIHSSWQEILVIILNKWTYQYIFDRKLASRSLSSLLCFELLDYRIKKAKKKMILARSLKGAATNQERPLFARVQYMNFQNYKTRKFFNFFDPLYQKTFFVSTID